MALPGIPLAAALLVAFAPAGAEPRDPDRDTLVRRSLHELHTESFDAALTTCAELRRRWPEDPAGHLGTANVYQTMMRDYRVRSHEAEFEKALAEAVAVAEKAVEKRPSAEAHFARATARAYRAVHRFTQGDWIPALFAAIKGVGDARRALELDPAFVDPLLATAVHDFWKAEKLGLGLGLFQGGRRSVVTRLERVRQEARFVGVEAAYALQTVHYRQGDLAKALQVNDGLRERFPDNPVGLYHRALILERLERPAESLAAWDALVARIQRFPHPSDGFLAECHLHRSRLLHRLAEGERPEGAPAAEAARRAAREHARRRDARRELEGPLVSFDEVRREIERP
jgi:tetratricopeptide (TPR) repeat protein